MNNILKKQLRKANGQLRFINGQLKDFNLNIRMIKIRHLYGVRPIVELELATDEGEFPIQNSFPLEVVIDATVICDWVQVQGQEIIEKRTAQEKKLKKIVHDAILEKFPQFAIFESWLGSYGSIF